MSPRSIVSVIFFTCLLFFSRIIPWSSFTDPDAFYHAHLARLIRLQGPLHSFPWLDLTTLGTGFTDQHFLFHLIQIPFVIIFGWAHGTRLVAILLASLFVAASFACARFLRIRFALVWTALLLLTSPLIVRLLLGKASPLALLFFLLGLTVAWKRKPIWVALIALLFSLSHGGWMFLVGSIFLLSIGDILFRKIVEEFSWRESVMRSLWKEFFMAIAGCAAGVVIHPNFPQNIQFLWIQVVKIGLGTPFANVMLGREWLPWSVAAFISQFSLWIIASLLGLLGLLMFTRKPLDKHSAHACIAFAFPFAACIALTMRSQRNAEYLAVAFFLWLPWIWNMIDVKAWWTVVRRRHVVQLFLFFVIVLPLTRGLSEAWRALHRGVYPDEVYTDAFQPVSERAHPGDRVFHSDWDEFPMLFRLDDRLRYVAGLDPTFLYEASSTLSNAYRELTWGSSTPTQSQAWEFIHDRVQARFVFIDPRDHSKLLFAIKNDPRYTPLKETPEAVTFEIIKKPHQSP